MISEGLLTAPPIARPRQVGKSSTIREFGKSFRYFAEVNFEMDLLSPKIDFLLFVLASPSVLRFGTSSFADAASCSRMSARMRPRVKRLPVTFSARFRADLEDFVPVEVLAALREDRLSGKKCNFGHSVLFLFVLW